MAETVLSMARSMLGSAISKAAATASEEMSLLICSWGAEEDLFQKLENDTFLLEPNLTGRFMKDELETMQAFLVAPEVTKKKDKLVKVWAKQVRDLSYDFEDCLTEFTVHVGSRSLSQQMMKLKDRHQIAVQIRNLKARVEEVSKRNTRYHLIKTEASNTTMDETESYLEDIRNHSASNIDEAQLVGFDEPKKKLLEMIQEVRADDGHARVISVVGMGGLGKTTLARKIYESKEDIAKNFTCRAWITVSQSFLKIDLLKDMIRQLLGDESLKRCLKRLEGKGLHVNDLASYLTQGLMDKMYFVILDDLWTIEAWNWINKFASLSNKSKGSRIIVTTRDAAIAKACSSNDSLVNHLQPLEIGDAKELLLRKAQKDTKATMSEDFIYNSCKLEDKQQDHIALNLSYRDIGMCNVTSRTYTPMEMDFRMINLVFDISVLYTTQICKPCFLYLSIFPEDFEIKRRRLVDRWIAEGLVTARGRVTVEEVGERYFQELISRSMILPARVNFEGVVKSCRVHDIVRDTIISISKEENFVYSTEGRVSGVRVPRGIGNLKALQIQEVVDLKGTSTKAIEELGDLSQLRKLSVMTRGAAKGKCEAFCNALLRSLKLIGKIGTTPAWFGDLGQLVKEYLEWTYLEDLEILRALPNLMLIQLFRRAYSGEKLTFRTGAFPGRRKLVLSQPEGLTEVTFEEDASPFVESIHIEYLKLESGIIDIKHLPRLKEISLGRGCKVAGFNMLQAEFNQHPNKPVLRLKEDRKYHDLGDVVGSGVEEEATEPQPDDTKESSFDSHSAWLAGEFMVGVLFFLEP
ncbi:unnamed protein product [Miscanthus lutarioriparius]|uniref:Uncharacterized protein n=1 Tax=Miscanthus lutarioriparius TaxID=422564 RepID=A0A811NC65_9POAL|nr:unnamed protein product [Miscanthus lutarioriparius]